MPTLTVLMGCPGSGKTTWARTHAGGAVVCTTDPLRTEPRLRDPGATAAFLRRLERQAERALRRGLDAIIDACNVHTHERSRWLRLAQQTQASPCLVICHAPPAQLAHAQQQRQHGVGPTKLARYRHAFDRALHAVQHEPWADIHHAHRAGGSDYTEPQPRRVSSW